MYQVVKRDGKIASFDISKISTAITKAFEATHMEYNPDIIDLLALRVTADYQDKIHDGKITVEDIQDSVEDILSKAQTEGSYIDLSLQWLYSTDYITTLTPCEGVTTGTYYLAWVGRSNNSHPLIRSVTAI